MRTYEDWQTDEMIRAERGLDDGIAAAYQDMYAADDRLDELAAEHEARADAWAEKCREYAQRDDVSPAWQAVAAKVEAGEITWRDVADGDAMTDPAVRAAIAADARLREAPEATPATDQDDDEYYDGFQVLGRRRR